MPIQPTQLGVGGLGAAEYASTSPSRSAGGADGIARGGEPISGGESFAATITRVLEDANRDQVDASQKVTDLVVHGRGTIHDAMVAVDNAEGSFRLLMEMRNRLIEGVNRLLETQI